MPISHQVDQFLKRKICILHSRMAAVYPEPLLTYDDVLVLCAPPEHRALLRDAPKVGRITHRFGDTQLRMQMKTTADLRVDVVMVLHGGDAPLLPRKPEPQADAPMELLNSITSWVTTQREIGQQFGRIKALVGWLTHACDTPGQVRYLWPSVLGLCSLEVDDSYGPIPESFIVGVQEFKRPRKIPPLTEEIRQELKDASTLIAQTLLLPNPSQPISQNVVLSFPSTSVRVKGLGEVTVALP